MLRILTERGKALLPTLKELYVWGEEQIKLDINAKFTFKASFCVFGVV